MCENVHTGLVHRMWTPTKFHLQLNHCKYIVNVRYNTHSYKDKDITTILMYTLIYTVQDSSSFLSIIILM